MQRVHANIYQDGELHWIELRSGGRSCIDDVSPRDAQMACLTSLFAIFQTLRLARKTCNETKVKDRNLRNFFQNPPFVIALHIIDVSLAGLIYCAVKWMSPETLMVDPADNPVFYVYYFLAVIAISGFILYSSDQS